MRKVTVLKLVRIASGKVQTEIAPEAGVSQGLYSLYESGRVEPPETIKEKLASMFGVSADVLFSAASTEKIAK